MLMVDMNRTRLRIYPCGAGSKMNSRISCHRNMWSHGTDGCNGCENGHRDMDVIGDGDFLGRHSSSRMLANIMAVGSRRGCFVLSNVRARTCHYAHAHSIERQYQIVAYESGKVFEDLLRMGAIDQVKTIGLSSSSSSSSSTSLASS